MNKNVGSDGSQCFPMPIAVCPKVVGNERGKKGLRHAA